MIPFLRRTLASTIATCTRHAVRRVTPSPFSFTRDGPRGWAACGKQGNAGVQQSCPLTVMAVLHPLCNSTATRDQSAAVRGLLGEGGGAGRRRRTLEDLLLRGVRAQHRVEAEVLGLRVAGMAEHQRRPSRQPQGRGRLGPCSREPLSSSVPTSLLLQRPRKLGSVGFRGSWRLQHLRN